MQSPFYKNNSKSAHIVSLCERVSVCVHMARGPLLLCPAAFQWNSCVILQLPPNKTDCLATTLPLANFPPPPTNRAGHTMRKWIGEQNTTESERTERIVRKFAVKNMRGVDERFQLVFPAWAQRHFPGRFTRKAFNISQILTLLNSSVLSS